MMNRQDYEILAGVIRTSAALSPAQPRERELERSRRDLLAREFAVQLEKQNPHFDRTRFIEAATATDQVGS